MGSDNKLNIVSIISSNLHSGPGVPALRHLKILQESGHNTLFLCKDGKNLKDCAEKAHVTIKCSLNLPRNGHIWKLRQDSKILKGIIEDFKPDLIFVHKTIETLLCGFAVDKSKIPVIRIWHDGSGKRISMPERIMHNFSRIPIVATSLSGKKATRFFAPVNDYTPLQGGVDTSLFLPDSGCSYLRDIYNISKESVIIGIISRLKKGRRLFDFLHAFKSALEENDNLVAVYLGKGELQDSLASEAALLGIDKKIIFHDAKDDFIKSLQSFDIGVLTSPGSDGGARAAFEIMSCGIPLAVLKNGSLSDFEVDNTEGVIHICERKEELKQAILRLVSDENLREKYGHLSRQLTVKKYSQESLQKNLNSLCLSACEKMWRL